MIPVLFKGNETNFNHNGIGLLKDTLSCEVSEVRNGSFDLELVYPITGSYFKDLKNGNIIQAKPNDTDQPHNFRITEIDKTLSDKEVVVYGVSITNDLGGNMVKSLYLEDLIPQVILNEMKNALHYPTTFNFVSNITTIGSVDWELNNPLNLIVGEEGSLVDIFGGEVKRTNDTVYLYGRRGKDNVTTIRAGKNLDGFKMTESFQGKYTQILPYFKYEEEIPGEVSGDTEGETIRQEVTVFGSVVSSPYHGRYPVNAIKPVDFSQNETVREAKTLEALNAEAALYFSDLYSEIDKPSVNINVDMVQLVDSEQYELYEKLEKIELTDTVSVYIPEYDVDVLVKVTELKYDSLRERTISIVAGSSGRTSLMDEISGSYKQFTKTLVDDKIQSATSGIINQILTKKDGGNVYAGRATPPDNAKKGDIWFKDTGGGDVELYEFDGVNWIRKMYKGFGDDVRQLVDSKIAEANVTITEALEEHDNTIAQAMTKAGQANDLAQQAKTEAANASLSASAANQDAQQAITDAANAKADALAAITNAGQANDLVQQAITDAANARTELLGRVNTLDSKAEDLTTKTTNLQTLGDQLNTKATSLQTQADSIAGRLNTLSTETGTKFQNQSNIITDIKGTLSEYSSTIQDIDGKVTNNTTQLTQQATQIASKVSQTDFNAEKTKITNLQTSVTQQAGQIALKANQTELNNLTGRMSTAEGKITTQAGQIELKANKSEFDTLTGRVSTAESKITATDGKVTTLTTKTDGHTTSIGQLQTSYSGLSSIVTKVDWRARTNGALQITPDPTFLTSRNGIITYNNISNSNVKVARVQLEEGQPTGSPYVLEISTTGSPTHPGLGGFVYIQNARANAIFMVKFTAKLPTGYALDHASNSIGNGAKVSWVTSTNGTGLWTEYAYVVECGSSGSFSSFGHMYVSTGVAPVTWYVAKYEMFDISKSQQQAFTALEQNLSGFKTTVQNTYADKTTVNQLADKIELKANTTDVDSLTGRVSTAEGKITTQAGQIELKAEKTYVDTVKQTVDSTTSRVTITEQSITGLVSGVKTLPDGRTSVFATKIESLEGAITQRVTTQELNNRGYQTATDVTNKLSGYVTNQTYTTYTTNRQQTDRQITEQINQTVSKVPTGPVNLVINGFDPQTISPWTSGGSGSIFVLTTHSCFYNSQKKMYMLSTATTTEVFSWTNIFNLKRNTKYTLRLGLLANSVTIGCDIFFMGKPTGGSFTYQHLRLISDLSPVEVVYYTITFDSGSFDLGQFRIDNNGSKTQDTRADLYICEISCIEGEYNNSWTPSFDELITEQKFNETKSTVDAFSRAIGTRDENGFVPNIARLVMTQDSFISEVAKKTDIPKYIGGRNYFTKSTSITGTNVTGISRNSENGFIFTGAESGSRNVRVNRVITENGWWTISGYIRGSQNVTVSAIVDICDVGAEVISAGADNMWSYFSVSVEVKNYTPAVYHFVDIAPDGRNYYYIKDFKVEKGRLATDWSPAPEDTEDALTVVSTRVEQTANSYSIKFLNNANDITTQLNLTNSGTRIKSSLIHLDGNVTVSGTAWMDGAVIKNLSADKITTGTLNANNVNITNLSVDKVSGITSTYLQSIIGTAFIDWMKGKVIQGYNDNMTIDLLGGNITLNSGSNAIKRVKGTHTAFVHFNDVSSSADGGVGSIYASIGVTSSGDGVDSMSSGRFAGLRAFRAASGTAHTAIIDQTEIYGDKVMVKDSFTESRGFLIRPTTLDRQYDLNDDVLNPIRFFVRLLLHLNNVGWNWQERLFIDSLRNEWNAYGMSRYGTFRNNTIYYP